MKNIIQFTVLLLFGILFTVTACTKDKHMAGEHKDWNVLEWTVDGERYKAECEGDPLFGCDPVDCQYYTDVNGGTINGGYLNKAHIYMHIYEDLIVNRKYSFGQYDRIQFADGRLSRECRVYGIDTSFNYETELNSIDTTKKIIQGKFEFTGVNHCQDTVKVDDGHFKLTYRP